jgi:superfamily II DNA/RNA helicase
MHRIGRTGRADKTGNSALLHRGKGGNWSLNEYRTGRFPTEVEVSAKLIEPEKSDKSLSF